MRERIVEEMLDLLAANADVQTIIDKAAEIMGNPVILVDSRFHIMYTPTDMEIENDLWKKTLESEYVSDQLILAMKEAQVINTLQRSLEPVEQDIPDGYHSIRVSIFHRRKFCGFIGVYDYLRPMEPHDGTCLHVIAKAVAAALYVDNSIITDVDNSYENLLHELLKCRSVEQAEKVGRKNPTISFGKQMLLIQLSQRGSEEDKKNLPGRRIKDYMTQYLYGHYSTVYEHRLVMLFCMDKISASSTRKLMGMIEKYCLKYDLVAGVSFPFTCQERIPVAYRQSVYASSSGEERGEKRIHYFGDYMVDSFLENALEKAPEVYYEHPVLHKLIVYDRQFKTSYLTTLKVYLRHFCNLKEAAAELEIHYNTMKYRISMIETITESDLRNCDTLKTQLYLSVMLHDYSEKIREGEDGHV